VELAGRTQRVVFRVAVKPDLAERRGPAAKQQVDRLVAVALVPAALRSVVPARAARRDPVARRLAARRGVVALVRASFPRVARRAPRPVVRLAAQPASVLEEPAA